MKMRTGETPVKITDEAEKMMEERFGRDHLIALATIEGDMPCVRYPICTMS